MLLMEPDSLRAALQVAATNDEARRARRGMCRALTTGPDGRVAGHLLGPQRVEGISLVGNGDDRLVALDYRSSAAAPVSYS